MTANQKKDSKRKQPATDKKARESSKPPALPHLPGVAHGAVDVIGIIPEEVRVDPDITEGHPGYDEGGPSELRVPR